MTVFGTLLSNRNSFAYHMIPLMKSLHVVSYSLIGGCSMIEWIQHYVQVVSSMLIGCCSRAPPTRLGRTWRQSIGWCRPLAPTPVWPGTRPTGWHSLAARTPTQDGERATASESVSTKCIGLYISGKLFSIHCIGQNVLNKMRR